MADLDSRHVRAGDLIFKEGDAADCAYVVDTGTVEIRSQTAGHDQLIATIHPGELLGEMAMLDQAPRSATAIAGTDVRLTIIERHQLSSRLQQADPVLRLLVSVLLNRLRRQLDPDHSLAHGHSAENTGLDRIKFENELKAGMGAGELRLYLQPIADIETRRIAGFEALVRWEHPERGTIRPDLFIKLAEESGLIVPLGRWILNEACRVSQLLEDTPNPAGVYQQGAFISVNVSTIQFSDEHFVADLQQVIAASNIPPKRLKLEITESSLTDPQAAKQWIQRCRTLGVRIALDDFGTGYSSLSYLDEFDLDTIKLDQSFVRKMMTNPRSRHVVEAILTLSSRLSLDIIAEGIETQEQFDVLKTLGCHYVQGYIISKPQPAAFFLGS